MVRCALLTLFILVTRVFANCQSAGLPQAKELLLAKFDKTITHRAFIVAGHQYELNQLKVTNPDDSRYGLTVVWLIVNAGTYELSVAGVGREGNISSTFEDMSHTGTDIVLMNGGFFYQKSNGNYAPMGLVVSDGVPTSKIWHWKSGGVIYSSKARTAINIVSIKDFLNAADSFEALQSKPLPVENFRLGIRSDDHQLANRTAVAICNDESLLFIGAFAEGGAVSLYEFGALLVSGRFNNAPVKTALNMDGGPGAHIFIPALNLHFGSETTTYVPNLIRVSGAQP